MNTAFMLCETTFHFVASFYYDRTVGGDELSTDTRVAEGEFVPMLIQPDAFSTGCLTGKEIQDLVKESLGQRHAEAMLQKQHSISQEWRKHTLLFPGTSWKKIQKWCLPGDFTYHIPTISWCEQTKKWEIRFFHLDSYFGWDAVIVVEAQVAR